MIPFSLICKTPVPDYIPVYCCDGTDCSCGGNPIDPCICSEKCWDALMGGIGKPYEQCRIDANIELYK